MPYTKAVAAKTVAPYEMVSWVLDNFSSTQEVKDNIGKIVVPASEFAAWHMVLPLHFIVTDAGGKSVVVEYIDGKLNVHDDPLGVITNSPSFDWQMTNLANYGNYSMHNPPPVKLGDVTIKPFGMGAGGLGLPGDFTPPSRFIRAVAFSQSAVPSSTGNDAVLQAFHILNQFDIPKGAAREHETDKDGNIVADYTVWTSASDLKTRQYFFRTYDNSQLRSVDLMKMNLDAADIITFSMKGSEEIKKLAP